MAYSTTYTTLLAELQSFVEDNGAEFVAELPNIINQAELRVARDLDLEIFKTSEDVTLSGETLAVPAGAIRVDSIFDTVNGRYLDRRSSEYVRLYGGAGAALYFAEESETVLRVAPAPTTSTAAKARVLKRPTALSESNATNWLAENAADLLLNAALVGCEHYLIAPERVGEFETAYQARLGPARVEFKDLRAADYGRLMPSQMGAG